MGETLTAARLDALSRVVDGSILASERRNREGWQGRWKWLTVPGTDRPLAPGASLDWLLANRLIFVMPIGGPAPRRGATHQAYPLSSTARRRTDRLEVGMDVATALKQLGHA